MFKLSVLTVGFSLYLCMGWSQCFPDRHSTSFQDGWYSCQKRVSPNPNVRPVGHWIQFDLGYVYELGSTHIWNANHPDILETGVKSIAIDYSLDGKVWMDAGTFEIETGSGRSVYEGAEGPDLGGVQAKYILLTVLENHGHNECSGFSEWKIEIESRTTSVNNLPEEKQLTVYPNPFDAGTRVEIPESGSGEFYYELRDILGRKIQSSTIQSSGSFEISGRDLQPGHYFINVFDGDTWYRGKLIKLD